MVENVALKLDKKTKFFELYRQIGHLLKEVEGMLEKIQLELAEERARARPKPERMKLLAGQEFMLREAVNDLEAVFLVWTDYGRIFEIAELPGSEEWFKKT